MSICEDLPTTLSEYDRKSKIELLKIWRQRMLRASLAHYRAADTYRRKHNVLTIFNMISAITVLFLSNNELFKNNLHGSEYLLPFASLMTVLSAAIHYLVRYQERSGQHKLAGNEFSILKRSIEREAIAITIPDEFLSKLSVELDHVAKKFPHVPRSIWTETINIMERTDNISVNDKDLWSFIDKGQE